MPKLSPRARVVRDAVVFTVMLLLCAVPLLLMLAGIWGRAIPGMVILVLLSALFGYQSLQSVRDLFAAPQEVSGVVARRWTKHDMLFAKSYYISINRAIFQIPADAYLYVRARDTVQVVAYPHSGTVVSVTRLSRPEAEPPTAPVATSGRLRTLRTARRTPRTSDGEDASSRRANTGQNTDADDPSSWHTPR